MRKFVIYLSFVAIMLLTGVSFGHFDNGSSTNDWWSNAGNWSEGAAPVGGTVAIFLDVDCNTGPGRVALPGQVTWDLYLGAWGHPGDLTIDAAGELTCNGWLGIGVQEVTSGSCPGAVCYLRSYGTLNVGAALTVGSLAPAEFNLHGGETNCSTLQMGFTGGGDLNLYGGTLTADTLEVDAGDMTIDITYGELRVEAIDLVGAGGRLEGAAAVEHVDTLVAAGKLTGFGGVGTVVATWDANEDQLVIIGRPWGATIISPIDWALVDVQLLEWLTPGPYHAGDTGTVLVNVYFGTDPNLIPGVYGTTQPVTGLAVNSTTGIPATLDLDTNYYLRVDCIDPNFGHPYVHKGYTSSFITTVPAGVIVTPTAIEVSEEGPTSAIYTVTLAKTPLTSTVRVTPGFPTVFELRILAGGDDVEESQSDGDISRSSSDLEMPWDGGTEQIIGLWWDNIEIPPGATITSASVDFQADSGSAGTVYLTVSGRLDDPGTFQQDINWMVSTPTITDDETTAEVEWTPGAWVDNDRYLTPDLTTIVQEIVDGPLWSFGRGLAITIRNGNSGGTTAQGSWRHAESFTGSTSNGTRDPRPVLRIEYTAGTGSWPVTWTPFVDLTSANWEAGVDVTVTAVDDSISETDPHFLTLPNVVSSADADWNAVTADDVAITILENDCGSWGYGPADFNVNCTTGLEDLAVVASAWFNDSSLTAPVPK